MYYLQKENDQKHTDNELMKNKLMARGYNLIDKNGNILEKSKASIDFVVNEKEMMEYKSQIKNKLSKMLDTLSVEDIEKIAGSENIQLTGSKKAEKIAELVEIMI